MAIIKSAPFSFVRFEHPEDNDYSLDIPFALPVYQAHNVAFQFILDYDRATSQGIGLGVGDTAGGFLSAFAVDATILSYRYRFNGLLTTSTFTLNAITIGATTKVYNTVVTRSGFAEKLLFDFGIDLVEDYIVLPATATVNVNASGAGTSSFIGVRSAYWHGGWIGVQGVPLLQTSNFTYLLLNSDNSVIEYSNEFMPVEEEAYTSLLTYYSIDDSFGFVYAAGKENIIRLPIYLKKPEFPKKTEAYRQSNGLAKVTSAFVEKQYEIETEQMPEVFHECLAIALSHDSVTIDNSNIRERPVSVIEADSYAAQWEDDLPQVAKGKGKVKVAAFGFKNSNC